MGSLGDVNLKINPAYHSYLKLSFKERKRVRMNGEKPEKWIRL